MARKGARSASRSGHTGDGRSGGDKITRADLEQGFRHLQTGVRDQVESRKSLLLTAAGGVGLAVVLVIFLLGRRSGKRQTTFVEIRRV